MGEGESGRRQLTGVSTEAHRDQAAGYPAGAPPSIIEARGVRRRCGGASACCASGPWAVARAPGSDAGLPAAADHVGTPLLGTSSDPRDGRAGSRRRSTWNLGARPTGRSRGRPGPAIRRPGSAPRSALGSVVPSTTTLMALGDRGRQARRRTSPLGSLASAVGGASGGLPRGADARRHGPDAASSASPASPPGLAHRLASRLAEGTERVAAPHLHPGEAVRYPSHRSIRPAPGPRRTQARAPAPDAPSDPPASAPGRPPPPAAVSRAGDGLGVPDQHAGAGPAIWAPGAGVHRPATTGPGRPAAVLVTGSPARVAERTADAHGRSPRGHGEVRRRRRGADVSASAGGGMRSPAHAPGPARSARRTSGRGAAMWTHRAAIDHPVRDADAVVPAHDRRHCVGARRPGRGPVARWAGDPAARSPLAWCSASSLPAPADHRRLQGSRSASPFVPRPPTGSARVCDLAVELHPSADDEAPGVPINEETARRVDQPEGTRGLPFDGASFTRHRVTERLDRSAVVASASPITGPGSAVTTHGPRAHACPGDPQHRTAPTEASHRVGPRSDQDGLRPLGRADQRLTHGQPRGAARRQIPARRRSTWNVAPCSPVRTWGAWRGCPPDAGSDRSTAPAAR